MESSKHDWTLSGTATSLQYFFLKILFLVPKVPNSWIFQKRCFMKIIWHRISIQTLLFQDVFAYTHQDGFQNRDKVYMPLKTIKRSGNTGDKIFKSILRYNKMFSLGSPDKNSLMLWSMSVSRKPPPVWIHQNKFHYWRQSRHKRM